MISNLVRVIEEGRFTERLLRQFTPTAVRNLKRPSIGDFLAAGALHQSAESLLAHLIGNHWRLYENEFAALTTDLAQRYEDRSRLPFPDGGRLQDHTAFAMYAWVRDKRPRMIVETGVANGHSTAVLLNALRRNSCGELHSVDIRGDAGALLNAEERERWNFHLLPAIGSRKAFERIAERVEPIDFFFHDSQHSYAWQMFEYHTAAVHMSAGALLGSDDADGNYAFLDFAKEISVPAESLLDACKVVGFLTLP